MKCPWCGGNKNRVVKTTHDQIEGEDVIVRLRKCGDEECGQHWKSFETYEGTGSDRALDQGEAASLIQRAVDWLKAPARHVPIVRDARKQLAKALSLLSPSAE